MPQRRPDLKRRPSPAAPPDRKARPVPGRLQGISADDHPAWRLSLLDLEYTGNWSWQVSEATLRDITELLTQMERLTWIQVRNLMTGGRRRGPLHKVIPVKHLCPEAQQRLEELQLDDLDELFRFRRGNYQRLWGIVSDSVFYALWWDEGHKVCPGRDRE